MNEDSADNLTPDWVERKLAELRRALAEGKAPPAASGRLLDDLYGPAPDMPAEELQSMLTLLVDEARQGVDITRRYPELYRALVRHPALHQTFVESLEILDESEDPAWNPLPGPPSRDLSFLHELEPAGLVQQVEPNRWRISWRRSAQELARLFRPGALAPILRGDLDDWDEEDDRRTLLRQLATVDGLELDVLLETAEPAEDTRELPLFLTVTRGGGQTARPTLTAVVSWGDYQASAVLDQDGSAVLPPAPLDAVYDAELAEFKDGLRLVLDIVQP